MAPAGSSSSPSFPASLTSVDGTIYDSPEVAAPFSSSGFSNYFERPDYQDNAVLAFLQVVGNQYRGLYKWDFVAMTVAGVVSLLNNYRILRGDRPLGWLNPWLYSDGLAGLNDDIIFRYNPGCSSTDVFRHRWMGSCYGLGTPNFSKLESIIDGVE
ncbi:hypothetical protein EDB84DRAFT_1678839 [Lactarius hengduanensis]|nr:hypothetical protein EDB84DRAFT_1678839 [Lactarius hengduanensis]